MKVRRPLGWVASLALCAASVAVAESRVHHQLEVSLDPTSQRLEVVDRMTLPPGMEAGAEFLLNAAFEVHDAAPAVVGLPSSDFESFFSLNSGPELAADLELRRYQLVEIPANRVVTLGYSGVVDFGLSDQKEEYTRGFRETIGVVGEEGVYLAGNGFWYPFFDDQLIEFELTAEAPEGWHLISQGSGTSRDDDSRARWNSGGPVAEIYLVGGPLTAYVEAAGAVEALVYLRQPDDALAGKYLEATTQYLEMYRGLLGPYPYGKFALVENFWETGYGMPSFTLLGPRVIRFPFILTSSYPHEILHNWWGNSVFVDFSGGNWSEGLTAYLADHLIQEQRGKGADYRRAALQRYRSYVQSDEDFPLAEFRARHSAATEAVGYGKTLMVFHMLRQRVGDEPFRQSLARFYRRFRGSRAAFADLQTVFEETTREDLGRFFAEWVTRPGAAGLAVDLGAASQIDEGTWRVTGRLRQTQGGEVYDLTVPLSVVGERETSVFSLRAAGKQTDFGLVTSFRPLALHVDPQFDLFRALDPREIPPSIGQIFGEPKVLAVLPGDATEEKLGAYRSLVAGWQSESHAIEMVSDRDLAILPADRSVWILGSGNRFASLFTESAGGIVTIEGDSVSVAGEVLPRADHSLVAVWRHPEALEKAVGWLVVEPAAAFSGIGRKLPHYGKYSYLGFAGEEPTNVLKGQSPTGDSPLVVDLRPETERSEPLPLPDLEERSALADLPPAFSQTRLMEHVRFLADPELAGRGPGEPGSARAAEYIAVVFRDIGLEPVGDDGFFQSLTVDPGPDGSAVETANVLGVLRGSRSEWSDQAVIVSAHYDHLGRGWPDVHQGDEGGVHPGADDNASGVAVLLELARALAAGETPPRTIVFAAFAAEEAGRAGSQFFVEHPTPVELGGIRAVVNLDTVGRLFGGSVSVLGTGTADEWQHIFRGASYVTGVESRNVPGILDASDQMSFIGRGIPGVQLFTGAHEDYHRPGDTVDKIDGVGLVQVATLTKEAIAYLAGREEPLSVTIAGAGGTVSGEGSAAGGARRRVRLGTVPDFAFQGPGVRIESVSPGSPAAEAGLRAGDLLLRIDEAEITDLRAYSDALKRLEPGQTVALLVRRAGEDLTISATVGVR